jgi:hypothetical protein
MVYLAIQKHMRSDFPFVKVPLDLYRIIGEPLPGTRMHRKEDAEDHIAGWEDVIFKEFGPCVSPGGAAQRAGVSRAAVHDRLKQGKLTGFFFYSTKPRRFLFGKLPPKRELMIGYIPVSEAAAWRTEIEQRAIKKGLVTREELDGDKPDWQGCFLESNSSFAKAKNKGDHR